MTFRFHPEAKEEFHDAVGWYEERSCRAADLFMEAVYASITAILADPLRYQQLEEGVRIFRLKKYPFRLYYTVDEAESAVCIYAVMHEKRRPGYWRNRTREPS